MKWRANGRTSNTKNLLNFVELDRQPDSSALQEDWIGPIKQISLYDWEA